MNRKQSKPRRVYTKKSMKLMWRVRGIMLILFFPLWFPLYALVNIGMWMEDVLDVLDSWLDAFLDKIIPQIK